MGSGPLSTYSCLLTERNLVGISHHVRVRVRVRVRWRIPKQKLGHLGWNQRVELGPESFRLGLNRIFFLGFCP